MAEEAQRDKKSRQRSPNYPAVGLRDAVERVKKLYEADKRAGSRLEVAVRHLGFSSPNGSALVVVSALKKYGLLEEINDRLVPTQRAVEILAYPESDPRHLEAVREAALKPDIYKQLFDRFSDGGSLPSDETFRAELEADLEFNPNAIAGFIRDFKDTLVYARLMNPDELTLSVEVPVMDSTVTEQKTDQRTDSTLRESLIKQKMQQLQQISTPVGTDGDQIVFAQVQFNAALKKEYVASLKKYLDYLETTLQ